MKKFLIPVLLSTVVLSSCGGEQIDPRKINIKKAFAEVTDAIDNVDNVKPSARLDVTYQDHETYPVSNSFAAALLRNYQSYTILIEELCSSSDYTLIDGWESCTMSYLGIVSSFDMSLSIDEENDKTTLEMEFKDDEEGMSNYFNISIDYDFKESTLKTFELINRYNNESNSQLDTSYYFYENGQIKTLDYTRDEDIKTAVCAVYDSSKNHEIKRSGNDYSTAYTKAMNKILNLSDDINDNVKESRLVTLFEKGLNSVSKIYSSNGNYVDETGLFEQIDNSKPINQQYNLGRVSQYLVTLFIAMRDYGKFRYSEEINTFNYQYDIDRFTPSGKVTYKAEGKVTLNLVDEDNISTLKIKSVDNFIITYAEFVFDGDNLTSFDMFQSYIDHKLPYNDDPETFEGDYYFICRDNTILSVEEMEVYIFGQGVQAVLSTETGENGAALRDAFNTLKDEKLSSVVETGTFDYGCNISLEQSQSGALTFVDFD